MWIFVLICCPDTLLNCWNNLVRSKFCPHSAPLCSISDFPHLPAFLPFFSSLIFLLSRPHFHPQWCVHSRLSLPVSRDLGGLQSFLATSQAKLMAKEIVMIELQRQVVLWLIVYAKDQKSCSQPQFLFFGCWSWHLRIPTRHQQKAWRWAWKEHRKQPFSAFVVGCAQHRWKKNSAREQTCSLI